ncbi:MAG TPA: hypothetical protein VK325_11275 [Pseudoxanthomonas sp.]|nr:hypothetical protein [Pseudoxanthomonas sp.]
MFAAIIGAGLRLFIGNILAADDRCRSCYIEFAGCIPGPKRRVCVNIEEEDVMYELNAEQIQSISGGGFAKTVLKWLGKTALGEAVTSGIKAAAEANGGANTGGYGDNYHSNLPPGVQ